MKEVNRKDVIKVVCISDTHNKTNKMQIPSGDILLHAGDFTGQGSEKDIRHFNDFLGTLNDKFKHKVVIAGNHDMTLDKYDKKNLR